MNSIVSPSRLGFIALILRKKRWESRLKDSDGIIVIQGHQLPVHTSILGSESSHLEATFQKSFQMIGKSIYYVHHWDVHSVWRALELIYLGNYSEFPYHKASCTGEAEAESVTHLDWSWYIFTDISSRLRKHASVYALAQSWMLPEHLRKVALREYKSELRGN